MALQDNFNAVYNKKEQAKQQKELIKQQDKTLELKILEDLQITIEGYITSYDPYNLYFLKTKRQIINSILEDNEYYVNKHSKYKDVQNIKNYIDMNYDKIVNKVIRTHRRIDSEIEKRKKEANKRLAESEELKKQFAIEETRQSQVRQENKEAATKILKVFQDIALFIAIGVVAFIWGFISEFGKKK